MGEPFLTLLANKADNERDSIPTGSVPRLDLLVLRRLADHKSCSIGFRILTKAI